MPQATVERLPQLQMETRPTRVAGISTRTHVEDLGFPKLRWTSIATLGGNPERVAAEINGKL